MPGSHAEMEPNPNQIPLPSRNTSQIAEGTWCGMRIYCKIELYYTSMHLACGDPRNRGISSSLPIHVRRQAFDRNVDSHARRDNFPWSGWICCISSSECKAMKFCTLKTAGCSAKKFLMSGIGDSRWTTGNSLSTDWNYIDCSSF